MQILNSLKIILKSVLVILILSFCAFGQEKDNNKENTVQEFHLLTTGERVERRIVKGEPHIYIINLKRGELVHITVQQKAVNIAVAIGRNDVEKKILKQVDESQAADGLEDFVFMADADGEYLFGVFAFEPTTADGSYILQNSAPFSPETKKNGAKYLMMAGDAAYQNKDFSLAVLNHQNAANLLDKQPVSSESASVLFSLGNDYFALENYRKAIDVYQQAESIFKKFEIHDSEAAIYYNIAASYSNIKDYEKSTSYYQQSLPIYHQLNDKLNEVQVLSNIGNNYTNLEKYSEATEFYEKSLPIFRELKDETSESLVLTKIGGNYFAIREIEKSLNYFQKALVIYRHLGDKSSQTITLSNISLAYAGLNDADLSLNFLEQSLELLDEIKEPIKKAQTMVIFGEIYFAFGKNADAIKEYEQVLEISRKVGNSQLEFEALRGIGNVQDEFGNYDEALKFHNQALQIAVRTNNANDEASQLVNISIVWMETGDYDRVFENIRKAQDIAHKNNDLFIEWHILNIMGVGYLRLGSLNKAEEYIKQAVDICRQLQERQGIAVSTGNLGAVYARVKQFDKAIAYFEQSLPVLRQSGNNRFVATLDYYYGMVRRERGELDKAVALDSEAVNIARAIHSPKFESRALVELGLDYLAQNKFELAATSFKQALILSRTVKAHDEEAAAFDGLMRAEDDEGNKSAAILYGKQAVNLLQTTRQQIAKFEKEVQISFVKDNETTYRRLADLLIGAGRIPEAQAVLDLLKEEEFSGLLKRSGNAEEVVPYSKAEVKSLVVLGNLATLGREKSLLAEKLEKGVLTVEEKDRYKTITKEIQTAEADFNKSLSDLATAQDTGQNFETITKDAQAFMTDLKTLGKGTVALYTVIVNREKAAEEKQQIKNGWIILVTPEFRKQYQIDVSDLENTVFTFRKSLQDDAYNPSTVAQILYKKLFRQKGKDGKTLENDLDEYFKDKPEKTLMWSLDGVLRYVPMAALHDGGGYLIEKYRNTVFNTASKGRLSASASRNWTVLGLGVSEAREESGKNFPKIEGTKRELDSIVAENPKDTGVLPGEVKMDSAFTAESLEDALLFDKNPVVHIASHFSYNASDIDSSFLLLGKGKLTVKELTAKSTLFENVDLLTLSACDTAMGSSNGKEVEGFAYVAQSLGAKSVLASLWQVADTGTDELMIRFYQTRKDSPNFSKGEAFRQAQIAMLGGSDLMKNVNSQTNRSEVVSIGGENKLELPKYQKDSKKPFAHPHYWAAFIMIGNWQ